MKILVVTLSNLGDVVLTLPVFQALHSRYPDASLDVITGASGRIVFEGDRRLRRVTVYDKKAGRTAKLGLLRDVRREHYDLIVDLRRSLIGLLGGAKKRNAYLTKLPSGHRAARHLAALKGLLPVGEAGSFLDGLAAEELPNLPPAPRIVAAVGSKSDLKKWPVEKYTRLLSRLAREKKCSVVLVGDASDAADAERVKAGMGGLPVQDLTGRTSLAQLASVLKSASLVVTNDSAPLHVADALGVPVLALFGPTDPVKYGPRNAFSQVVSKKLFCQPCERAQCRFRHECLEELEPEEVYQAAVRLLEGRRRSGSMNLLVVRLDRIGDLVLSLPAIEALRKRFPEARITLMTRPATRPLLEGHPALDEVLAYDYKKGGRHAFPFGYLRLLAEVRKRRFDAAVILHPGIRSYLVPFLAAVRRRVGYRNKHAWLLTHPVKDERHLGRKHESEYALDVAAALIGVRVEGPPPRLQPDLSLLPRGCEGRWIALHPGASCPSKRWSVERFGRLASHLSEAYPGYGIAVVGGPETTSAAQELKRAAGCEVTDLTGKLDLRQLPAFLSRCALLISNDSGPVHVAAASGTRVISLFGRNQQGLSATRWKPLGEGHTVIQKNVGCQVCLAHECPIEFECLKAIEVEDVMNAVRKTLAR